MTNTKIIKRERQEVPPQLIDAALLATAAAERVSGRRSIHLNNLGVAPGLHRKMHQLLDQLSDSFGEQMKSVGVGIDRVQISWRPLGNEQDAYEKLNRSQLILEVKPIGSRQLVLK